MNILIIEDDVTDMKLLAAVLIQGGHNIEEHTSALQALESVKKNSPDVVLLDLKLPGLDGLSFVRLLKADPAVRRVPVVALTAAIEQFGRDKAFDAGCDAYITKPVDTRELARQITAVVTAKTAAQSGEARS